VGEYQRREPFRRPGRIILKFIWNGLEVVDTI
jgi:hypothetical protein